MVWSCPQEVGFSSGEEGREFIGRRGEEERQTKEVVGGAAEVGFKALNLNETMIVDRCSWRRQIRVVDSLLGSGSVVESLRVGLSRLALT